MGNSLQFEKVQANRALRAKSKSAAPTDMLQAQPAGTTKAGEHLRQTCSLRVSELQLYLLAGPWHGHLISPMSSCLAS